MKTRLGKDLITELTSTLGFTEKELSNIHLLTGEINVPSRFIGLFKDPMELHTTYKVTNPKVSSFTETLIASFNKLPALDKSTLINLSNKDGFSGQEVLDAFKFPNGNIIYCFLGKNNVCCAGFIGNLLEQEFRLSNDDSGLPVLECFIGTVGNFKQCRILGDGGDILKDIYPSKNGDSINWAMVKDSLDIKINTMDSIENAPPTVNTPAQLYGLNLIEELAKGNLDSIQKLFNYPIKEIDLLKLADHFSDTSTLIKSMIPLLIK